MLMHDTLGQCKEYVVKAAGTDSAVSAHWLLDLVGVVVLCASHARVLCHEEGRMTMGCKHTTELSCLQLLQKTTTDV